MADIGLNPPGTRHDKVVGGAATVTGILFGHLLVMDTGSAGAHRAVTNVSTAGVGPTAGVCVSQTDPTSGSAVGDNLEVCYDGIVEVWLAASNTIAKGDKLIHSGTAGQVKKMASETTPEVVGVAMQDMASNANPTKIAMRLGIYQHA